MTRRSQPSRSKTKGNKLPSISLCLIARDEEEFIAQCINSVQPIVAEVILVDTGSSDDTVKIAEAYGARVFTEPWEDDFSKARNSSLAKASGDWILVLDADEAIAERDLDLLVGHTLTRGSCYLMTQRHYSNNYRVSNYRVAGGEYPEWEREWGGFFESSLVRLFPNDPAIRYMGKVHELVEHSIFEHGKLKIVPSPVPIHHYGHAGDVRKRKQKSPLYFSLGKAKVACAPNDERAWFELAVEHLQAKRLEECVGTFQKVLALNPDHESAWMNMGCAYVGLQRLEEAGEALQQALRISPANPETICNLGVVYFFSGRYEDSIRVLKQALELRPDYVNAYLVLGQSLLNAGRTKQAISIFFQALEILPQCTSAKLSLAVVLYRYRYFEEAQVLLEQVRQEDPEVFQTNFMLAEIYREKGRLADALAAYQEFHERQAVDQSEQPPWMVKLLTYTERRCRRLARQLGFEEVT